MREKYRKSIASLNKFPQFTTMNVIDGQAGLIIYTSLIFYSLTIDNILNIIVLLILAMVSISLVMNGGIIERAERGTKAYSDAEIGEQIKLAYADWQLAQYNGETKTAADYIKDSLKTTFNLTDDKISLNEENGTYTVEMTVDGKTEKYTFTPATGKVTKVATTEGESEAIGTKIENTTSYVGYYADVNGDGTVDGVIFADLAFDKSGEWYGEYYDWAKEDGAYSYDRKEDLNEYSISEEKYAEGKFGEYEIITKVTDKGEGKERFYVMALEDIDSSGHYWYKSVNGNMSDYSTATSLDFGTGKKNTEDMITKWNAEGYGSKDSNDMWGLIQTQVAAGWFVPSRGEWGAFGDYLAKRTENPLTTSNYNSSYGLSVYCWSSSQSNAYDAWSAHFLDGCIASDGVTDNDDVSVRLATTF